MASLPGAAMKKSSGYGSALGRARAISVSARAGTAALSAAAAASPYQRVLGQFGLQPVVGGSHVAAAHIFAAAQQLSGVSGVAAFFVGTPQPEGTVDGVAAFIVSASAARALQQRISFCQ